MASRQLIINKIQGIFYLSFKVHIAEVVAFSLHHLFITFIADLVNISLPCNYVVYSIIKECFLYKDFSFDSKNYNIMYIVVYLVICAVFFLVLKAIKIYLLCGNTSKNAESFSI